MTGVHQISAILFNTEPLALPFAEFFPWKETPLNLIKYQEFSHGTRRSS